MVTDDERREVARRLRGIKDTREGCGHDLCCDLWSAVFDSNYRCTDLCDECEVAVLNSLADLIEPSEGQNEPDVSVDRYRGTERGHHPDIVRQCPESRPEMSGIDRDALLALADKMERRAGDFDATVGDVPMVHAGYLTAYAERIREACGEAVDGC